MKAKKMSKDKQYLSPQAIRHKKDIKNAWNAKNQIIYCVYISPENKDIHDRFKEIPGDTNMARLKTLLDLI